MATPAPVTTGRLRRAVFAVLRCIDALADISDGYRICLAFSSQARTPPECPTTCEDGHLPADRGFVFRLLWSDLAGPGALFGDAETWVYEVDER